MSPDDLTDYGQAKACPFFVFAAGEIGLVKAVPDQRLFRLGNSDAIVPDRHKDCLSFFRRLDHDVGVRAAEFQSVVDQVIEDLLDFFQIRVDKQDSAHQNQVYMDVAGAADLLEGGRDGADHGIDVEIRSVQQNSAGSEVVEGEKAVGQFGQALGFRQDDAQIMFVALRGNGSVQHGLQKSPDRREILAINFF